MAGEILSSDHSHIIRAVELLKSGQLVAFPTETVYGLGADANNTAAVEQIFSAKRRPTNHPVIVHVSAQFNPLDWAQSWSLLAQQLANSFWPGPLTLIVKRGAKVLDAVTGGQDTVGLRCPSHPVAQALLSEFEGGIAAPSANRFGHISPTTAQHVYDELGDCVSLILDGGLCDVGIESTIVDLSRDVPVLLRPGNISIADLENALNQKVLRPDATAPRVSGSLTQHYAPSKPLIQLEAENLIQEIQALIIKQVSFVVMAWSLDCICALQKLGLNELDMSRLPLNSTPIDMGMGGVIRLPNHPHLLAKNLYAAMRYADSLNVACLWIEQPPAEIQWEGISDRLRRASTLLKSNHL